MVCGLRVLVIFLSLTRKVLGANSKTSHLVFSLNIVSSYQTLLIKF
jgi:hypothetical protein